MTNNLSIIDFENQQTIETLINTVAKGATVPEFRMFAEMCKASGLNPYKKEIWCIISGTGEYRKVQMMTGINGFYTIANSQKEYDGIELEFGDLIAVPLDDKRTISAPQFVKAIVHRKDRKIPFTAIAYWEEFAQPLLSQKGKLTVWGQKPRVMLSKCAEAMALRKAFPQQINGLYVEEEYNPEIELENITPQPKLLGKPDPRKRLQPNFEGLYRYQFPVDMDATQQDWISKNVMILDHKAIDSKQGIYEFLEPLMPQLNKFYMEITNE